MITDTARLTAGSQSSARLSNLQEQIERIDHIFRFISTGEGMFEGKRFVRPEDPEASPKDYSGCGDEYAGAAGPESGWWRTEAWPIASPGRRVTALRG